MTPAPTFNLNPSAGEFRPFPPPGESQHEGLHDDEKVQRDLPCSVASWDEALDTDNSQGLPHVTSDEQNHSSEEPGAFGDTVQDHEEAESRDKIALENVAKASPKSALKSNGLCSYDIDESTVPVCRLTETAAVPDASNVELYNNTEITTQDDKREHLNLVFIGHVDAGKSTLSGNILYLTEHVDKRTIEKYEREAKTRNRESWFLAFIMDTNEEERAKGKTVEVGRAPFSTQAKRYTILDAPGHKNYVPHMISGAAQADVGVLVISARRGEFETGFERGGQTREHAMLAKTLGVRYLLVVVNKMDDPTVRWARARYEDCVKKLKPFLKSCGYTIKKEVKFLPISGLTGANVKTEVEEHHCSWWRELWRNNEHNTGEATLLDCLDNLSVTGRCIDAPLRVPILDRYHDRGTIAMGKVEAGQLVQGEDIVVMPTNVRTRVEAVFLEETRPSKLAKPGENVCVKLAGIGIENINKGFVLCSPLRPCLAVTSFTAQIALVELLEHRPIFTAGYSCMLHAHTCETECTVTGLLCHANDVGNKSGGKGGRSLRFAKQGAVVVAILSVPQSICLEAYEDVEQLGRFTLRDEGKSIAIGKVLSLDNKHHFPDRSATATS